MTASPFDHPYLSGLLGDEEVSSLFSAAAELEAILAFEVALAKAEAAECVIPAEAAHAIETAAHRFSPDIASLREATARDGVVVPDLVRQLRAVVGEPHGKHVHFGATSQDAIDSGFMLRLARVLPILESRLSALIEDLHRLTADFGQGSLMGRTRMQPAIPILAADRIRTWRQPLERHSARLKAFAHDSLAVQLGGAAGTLDKLGERASSVRAVLARELGLVDVPQWHTQRERIGDLAALLASITGSVGKFGQDIVLMADRGQEIALSGGGGSSAMPHKQNPVAAEVLVTLSRFNAVQLGGLAQAALHEQERSGAAWTLEWLILPQMVMTTSIALRLMKEVTGSITHLGCK
ncbi:3-carboxy-cis,cis-muconate cycloisomerase [Rhizobium rosettiformans]|uniref:3-carboxy-cis,cis-muconate cycloisomerase n=1 Tax=Rhizobium rosettiformans TaxID=1368430 RepID=UPI002860A387|nr:3-carboxy-cis,cis-muconate cycloisomerase [Rhizobium rosettiformans]MDR7031042.1 3-carboxy-cis,cis-muconate cycloisomerase [Rhizobium rosettiformans]MDR7066946.1 3-carboxy-cis,cis-muconate cycloisomerase [Rhizobium rosettiformans]